MNDEKRFDQLKEALSQYSSEHFLTLIPKGMLGLTDEQKKTIEFAFWFCYIVEKSLTDVLEGSISQVKDFLGKTPLEVDKILKEKYKINFQNVDSDHPDYDPDSVTFFKRIDIIEKLRGEDDFTRFLRKVKKIRNDISHGRILSLSYSEKSLFEKDTKVELLYDYIYLQSTFKEDAVGGAISTLDPEDKERINKMWDDMGIR